MSIDELKAKKSSLISETRSMLNNVKAETRNMTDQEQEMFDNNLKEIEVLKSQIEKLQDQLLEVAIEKKEDTDEKQEEIQEKTEEVQEKTEEVEQPTENQEVEEKTEETEEEQPIENQEVEETTEKDPENSEDSEEDKETQDENSENKNKRNLTHNIMKKLIQQEIREAMENGSNKLTLEVAERAITVTGSNGEHDDIIETKFENILDPMYSQSVISNFTVFKGMPLSDIKIPIMTAANAEWASETGTATTTANTFTSITLRPKRIAAQCAISKMLLAQDTLDAAEHIKRDIVNALVSKVQKTLLGSAAGTTTKPAGIFYGVTAHNITNYKDLCEAEALVEDSNVGMGGIKYLMSNHAKAALRSMIKGTNATGMVFERGEVDGTPAVWNSDIEDSNYCVGDLSKIYFANFGNLDLTIDPFTLAADGQIKLVINAYFDWAKALNDQNVIVYGSITEPEEEGNG